MNSVWEILVPTHSNDGKVIDVLRHRQWDSWVRQLTGGLSICSPIKGIWVNKCGKIVVERMIPVKIMCSNKQIEKISDITAKFYEQEAVMFYKISNNVKIKLYNDKRNKSL